jgi:hypothetical protein
MSVEQFNPTTGKWEPATPLPMPSRWELIREAWAEFIDEMRALWREYRRDTRSAARPVRSEEPTDG